jgi:hypothetical protein
MDVPALNFHFSLPSEVIAYKKPSFEPTKIVLFATTGDDFMASPVLNDHNNLRGGEIWAADTPVSWLFPLKEGQLSLPAICAAAVNEVVRYRIDI